MHLRGGRVGSLSSTATLILLVVLAMALTSCDAQRATESAVLVRKMTLRDSTGLVKGLRARLAALVDPAACTVDAGVFDVGGWTPGSYPVSRRGDGTACATTVTSDPDTPYPLLQSAFWDREQKENLRVTFSAGVGSVHLSGMGAIKCTDATYGTAIAYSADSAELGRANFTLIDPTDCSPPSNPDDVTFGAEATLPIAAGVRRIVILPPQPWSFDVLGNEGFVTAFYTISFLEAEAPAVTIKGVKAKGRNAGGSFTSTAAESRIDLEALVTGAPPGTPVRWTFLDDPSDQVASGSPAAFTGAAVDSARIPAQDSLRWESVPHRAPLARKALRYVIRASATVAGTSVASADVTLGQSEVDALRQEYIDFKIPLPNSAWLTNSVPASLTVSFEALNSGDYTSLAILDPVLLFKLDTLQRDARYTFSFSSGFRNPVHHRYHIAVSGGGTPVARSNHQYGMGADIRTHSVRVRWRALRGLAWNRGACVEPARISTFDHIHADWRLPRDCSAEWRRPP